MSTVSLPNTLPADLAEWQVRIEAWARECGLDFFPTIFEVVTADQLHTIAAYGGFPRRYPHWRWGMEYEQLRKGYLYGLQKIYELVINTNPCYAYLLNANAMTDQKLVMAHVYGHCDFFKNNAWFQPTHRKMMDVMANHGVRVSHHMDQYGVDKVESFIDACLSIEDLIDVYHPFATRTSRGKETADAPPPPRTAKFPAKGYMDRFINPRLMETKDAEEDTDVIVDRISPATPAQPVRDVLGFLLEHAPLRDWQRDVLAIIRDEAYYFAPQAQTKIMNEGWASYWHSSIMTRRAMDGSDVIHYCDHHSGVMASGPHRFNPYKLGIELYRDIEDRWNRGAFGKDYDDCDDLRERANWNQQVGKGRDRIFDVRRIHNDVTFIDEYLTLDFCQRHKMFSFGYNASREQYEIESREFPAIKQRLLFQLANRGSPVIRVSDGNYKNRGELFLRHDYRGVELKMDYAKDVLAGIYRIWSRPVHVETELKEKKVILSFNGTQHSENDV